jgi:hypothetical protein
LLASINVHNTSRRTDMMNQIATAPTADLSDDPKLYRLRREIGWICQILRLASPIFAIWVLFLIARNWSDVALINQAYGRFLQRDLSGIEPWQQVAAFGVEFTVWLFTALACYSIWRLFSLFRSGAVLTLGAALWLRRIAVYGMVSEIIAILSRPLMSVIATLHLPAGQNSRIVNIFFTPSDLALLLLLFVVLALAHVQKSAAEIASEHSQFV